MGVNTTEFESFEQQFLELIGEFQVICSSEGRLRESLRAEAARAEAAEAEHAAAAREASEARAAAGAANAATAQAAAALAKTQDELVATKMQFDLAERHRILLETKCSELSGQLETANREVERLKPLQSAIAGMQRQYTELQERINNVTREAKQEASRLEVELRRVEKSASGGEEVRVRARLAAAAHARDRRLSADELHHARQDLKAAKNETTKLGAQVAELQCRLLNYDRTDPSKSESVAEARVEALAEARAALEAERAGAARLERALATSLADNAALAAHMHAEDNASDLPPPLQETHEPPSITSNTNCPIDSFLAE